MGRDVLLIRATTEVLFTKQFHRSQRGLERLAKVRWHGFVPWWFLLILHSCEQPQSN